MFGTLPVDLLLIEVQLVPRRRRVGGCRSEMLGDSVLIVSILAETENR